ncbi:MAG: hypothetical protein ACMXYB_02760 [Candidatus Woesearchaeota archaeon]
MFLFDMFKFKSKSSIKLFGKQLSSDEQRFLESIQKTHSSFTAHKDAMQNINSEQDITVVNEHLTKLMQELQQFTSQCEQIRAEETQLFDKIKELINSEIIAIRDFLINFESELPIAVQLNSNMKSIVSIVQKSVKEIQKATDLLVNTFVEDLKNAQTNFSKSLNNDVLQNSNLQQLEQQRTVMHEKLQQAIMQITDELAQLQRNIQEHSALNDNSFFTKMYEFREQLKNLSLLIHERVGISNLLILLSFQEELKAAHEVSQIAQNVQHVEEQLTPELKRQFSQTLARSTKIISDIKQQSQALDKVVRYQSQGFFSKISKSFGINFMSQGTIGMYKASKFLYHNASDFRLTYKYLKAKMEETSSRGITEFLNNHPEFKEYTGAQMALLQYNLSQKLGSKIPTWINKYASVNQTQASLLAAQRIVSKTQGDRELASKIGAVNSFLLAVCISTILTGAIASRVTQEMI